eukprot:Skav227048  [mRNA]  locus=scaffold72:673938:684112:- [translate_table: standard]
MMYPCPDLCGSPLNLIDTPGVGDWDCTVIQLVSMIEAFLTEGMVPGGIRGVVVALSVNDARINLGAQIVQAVVDKGVVAAHAGDKYANIILCGTKVDKADPEDITNFLEGLDGAPSALASKLGMEPEEFESQMDGMRAMDRRRAEQARVERERQLELMRQEQNEERRREREQAAETQRQLMEQMQQDARPFKPGGREAIQAAAQSGGGVTKEIMMYPCPNLDGVLIDTPGVGDMDCSLMQLISMIEAFLTEGMVPGGIRAVVVTLPVNDARIKLGAQIVQAVVDKGFVAPHGGDKYANIILCGTKADKADPEDITNFMEGLDGGPSDDYSQLLHAIRNLPRNSIAFEKPKPGVMAQEQRRAKQARIEQEQREEQMRQEHLEAQRKARAKEASGNTTGDMETLAL